jgi:hypothetical protein
MLPGGIYFGRAVLQRFRVCGCYCHYVLLASRESGQVALVAAWFWPRTALSSWSMEAPQVRRSGSGFGCSRDIRAAALGRWSTVA